MKNVILQAFNWSYPLVADRAADIARAGYGAVLSPPPLYSDENGQAWWQVYQPKDYRVLRSHLGRKAGIEHDFHPERNEETRIACYDFPCSKR